MQKMNNNMTIRNERQSGVELLRILAVLGVVILHFCFPGGFGALKSVYSVIPTDKTIVLGILESISVCAVNVFILITGYFLSTSMRRTIGKPLGLLIQLIIIKLGLWLIGIYTGNHQFSFSGLFFAALPKSYFVSLYIALYLISPYLNYVLRSFSIREWKVFLLIIFSLFSFWEIIINIGSDVISADLGSMSAISHWGGQCGHTIINFALLYCTGAFLRLNSIHMKTPICFLGFTITSFFIFLWLYIELQYKTEVTTFSFGYYFNPLVILQSVFAFLCFKNFTFKNRFVNDFAKAAFTCYIINGLVLSKLGGGMMAVRLSSVQLVFFIVFGAFGTYLLAYIIHKIFYLGFGKILIKLDKCEIKYWDE